MTKADIILDLNKLLSKGDIFPSDYRQTLEYLNEMQMHEEVEQPPKIIVVWNEQEGLRVECPDKHPHIALTIARWAAVVGLAVALVVK